MGRPKKKKTKEVKEKRKKKEERGFGGGEGALSGPEFGNIWWMHEGYYAIAAGDGTMARH